MPTLNFFKPERFLLEDDEYEQASPSTSGMPTQAPPLLSMGKPEQDPRWTALDQYSDVVSKQPEIKRPDGWKGTLQTVGKTALGFMYGPGMAERIMHPKFSRQMEDYGADVDEAKAQAGIEGEFIQRGVNQAKLESQQRADERRGAQADAQREYAIRQTEKLNEPKPGPQMIEITPEMGKRLNVMPDADGKYRIPANQASVLRPAAERTPSELGAYIEAAGGDVPKGLKAYGAAKVRQRIAGRAPRGSGSEDGGRKMPAATAANIEGEKMAARIDAKEWADAEIKRTEAGQPAPAPSMDTEAKGRPRFTKAAEAEAWLQQQLEKAQRIYEGKIGAATGNYPAPLEILPRKAAAPPTPPAPPAQAAPTSAAPGSAAQQTYTEKEVREQAKTAGLTPVEIEAAVKKARERGLLR